MGPGLSIPMSVSVDAKERMEHHGLVKAAKDVEKFSKTVGTNPNPLNLPEVKDKPSRPMDSFKNYAKHLFNM